MAIFRSIQMSFWTDAKVADDFTPEDKFMYLYLMTNPHTNLCGCYEISMKQISDETGYTKATVEKLIKRLEEVHKVVLYSKDTKEVLILNWSKYNWSSSEKFRKPLLAEIQNIKNAQFKATLTDFFNGIDTVSIPYQYGSDTTVTVTVTDTDTDTVSNPDTKNTYGEYKHVRLTERERDRLFNDYGEQETLEAITYLDEYKQRKGYKSKDDNLTLRKWVFDAVKREKQEKKKEQTKQSLAEKWGVKT